MLFFFILLLLLSYKVLSNRNKIFNFEQKNVSYIELIQYNVDTMTNINNPAKVKEILLILNSLKGERVEVDNSEIQALNFINVYDKSSNSIGIAKSDKFIRIKNNWYKLDSSSSKKFDSIFEKYDKK